MKGNKNGEGDLQSEYEWYSTAAERVAFLIIVALAVEIAAVFILHKPPLESALTIVATALIAIGVWGEILLEKRAKTAGDGIVAQAERAQKRPEKGLLTLCSRKYSCVAIGRAAQRSCGTADRI